MTSWILFVMNRVARHTGEGSSLKREGLRRRLALAMVEQLRNHRLSFANAKRYVTPTVLCEYQIRQETTLTAKDYTTALKMAHRAIVQNPPSFRRAPPGTPAGDQRVRYMLTTPLDQLYP